MKRFIQIITGFHRIHNMMYSYGFKIPFISYGYFDKYGLQKINTPNGYKGYHDCTKTNKY